MHATLRTATILLAAFGLAALVAWTYPALDLAGADWVATHLSTTQHAQWDAASWPGATLLGLAVAGIGAVLLAWKHERRAAIVTLAAAVGSAAFVASLKRLLMRERPTATEHGYAFPSGHSASAMLAWGLVALIVLPSLTRAWPRLRRAIPLAVGLWLGLAAAVGVARFLAGVHWPTDVVAGWAWGGAVLAVAVHLTFPPTQPAL